MAKRTMTTQPKKNQAEQPGAPPAHPMFSVCMIVKNEVENLRPCLEPFIGTGWEIIVVDTGSTDSTPALAESLGARVYHFPWTNDFAAARNEALRHATGEWTLYMDADDRPTQETVRALEALAQAGKADAYSCWVVSRRPDGTQDVTRHIRLFRHGLGIVFSRAIHETVLPALQAGGFRLSMSDVSIQHIGYSALSTDQAKAARNLPLIESELSLHPEDVELLYYRARARASLEDDAGAHADLEAFLTLTETQPAAHATLRLLAYVMLAGLYHRRGEDEGAHVLVLHALEEFPQHAFLLFVKGRQQLVRGEARKAVGTLKLALASLQAMTLGLQPTEAQFTEQIAQSYLMLSEWEEALLWAERAYAAQPNSLDLACLLLRAQIGAGLLNEAEASLQQQLAANDGPEFWLVRAELRLRQGRLGEAVAAVQIAHQRGLADALAADWLNRLRGLAMKLSTQSGHPMDAEEAALQIQALGCLAEGELLKAAEFLAAALERGPTNPDHYRYLAVVLDKLGQRQAAIEAWQLAEYWANTQQVEAPIC